MKTEQSIIGTLEEIKLLQPLLTNQYNVYFGTKATPGLEVLISNVYVDFTRKRIHITFIEGFYDRQAILTSERILKRLRDCKNVDNGIFDNYEDTLTLEYMQGTKVAIAQHVFTKLKVKNKGSISMDAKSVYNDVTDAVHNTIELKYKTCEYHICYHDAVLAKKKAGKKAKTAKRVI